LHGTSERSITAAPIADHARGHVARTDIPPAAAPARSRAKRVFDLAFATFALVLASPVLVAIGVVVKVSSPGPILFRQRRVGCGGRTFIVYKFRTMRYGASDQQHRDFVRTMLTDEPAAAAAAGGPTYKLHADDRITRVGRWLRKTSLDELPQLINVVMGDMSMVGPRPPIDYEVEWYETWQLGRLTVRPGITGLWQVSGRNHLSYAEMCRLDLRYISEWSLLGDLGIIIRTPWVMLSNSGGTA
jgi:lipopolysaccharide/colanic/teichoic acid biosynthesis glycosyltransferase